MSAMPWLAELCQAKQAKIDRLRAENAELREDISEAINQLADPCDTCDFESREKALEATIDVVRAILVKTAKEEE